jgi:serine/threonine-protein kinase
VGKDAPVQNGDVVAGKYRVERLLGKGGMGIVFTARDVALDRTVAIKMLLPALAADEDSVVRFRREARAAVRLKSEHSVRIHDVGDHDGTPFIVMEFLTGEDLGAILDRETRLPAARAVDYVLQALEGIAEAHAVQIVHRDLKPENLFVTRRVGGAPLVKVLDFGLAKARQVDEISKLTSTSAVMGSPHYMSPEQLRASRDVDHRTDVWALGVTLYQLVTGQLPFNGATVPDLCGNILHQTPPPPHIVWPEVPKGLSRAILRCLEKDAAKRIGNVGELAHEIEPWATGAGAASRVTDVLEETQQAPRTAAVEAVVQAKTLSDTKTDAVVDSRGRKNDGKATPWLWAGSALIVLAGLTTAAYALSHRRAALVPVTSPSVAAPPIATAQESPPPSATPSSIPSAAAVATASTSATAPTVAATPRKRPPRPVRPTDTSVSATAPTPPTEPSSPSPGASY